MEKASRVSPTIRLERPFAFRPINFAAFFVALDRPESSGNDQYTMASLLSYFLRHSASGASAPADSPREHCRPRAAVSPNRGIPIPSSDGASAVPFATPTRFQPRQFSGNDDGEPSDRVDEETIFFTPMGGSRCGGDVGATWDILDDDDAEELPDSPASPLPTRDGPNVASSPVSQAGGAGTPDGLKAQTSVDLIRLRLGLDLDLGLDIGPSAPAPAPSPAPPRTAPAEAMVALCSAAPPVAREALVRRRPALAPEDVEESEGPDADADAEGLGRPALAPEVGVGEAHAPIGRCAADGSMLSSSSVSALTFTPVLTRGGGGAAGSSTTGAPPVPMHDADESPYALAAAAASNDHCRAGSEDPMSLFDAARSPEYPVISVRSYCTVVYTRGNDKVDPQLTSNLSPQKLSLILFWRDPEQCEVSHLQWLDDSTTRTK